MKQSPTSANRLALAAAYVQAKQLDKGLALIAQSIQAEPKDYDFPMMAGRVHRDNHKLKQFQPALEAYEKFLELDNGKRPDEEFKARQRARILRKEIERR